MARECFTRCKLEKNIEKFYNKYTECKICYTIGNFKGYYEKKD